jgi:hypothetical protein
LIGYGFIYGFILQSLLCAEMVCFVQNGAAHSETAPPLEMCDLRGAGNGVRP